MVSLTWDGGGEGAVRHAGEDARSAVRGARPISIVLPRLCRADVVAVLRPANPANPHPVRGVKIRIKGG
eukprot:8011957-Pyramimonas_sp.AAC.1